MKYIKYLKVVLGLILIPLCVFVGSLIHIGGGNGAILGGILGAILCCLLFWSGLYWANTSNLDEQHQVNHNIDKHRIDSTVRNVQRAGIEEEIRTRGRNHQF